MQKSLKLVSERVFGREEMEVFVEGFRISSFGMLLKILFSSNSQTSFHRELQFRFAEFRNFEFELFAEKLLRPYLMEKG